MDGHESKITQPCPFDSASLLSKLLFTWLIPLFKVGNRKDLELDDLHKPPKSDEPDYVTNRLEKSWNLQVKHKKKPSMTQALLRAWGWEYALTSFFNVIAECVIRVIQPLLVGIIIRYFSQMNFLGSISTSSAYWATFWLCFTSIIYSLLKHHWFTHSQRMGMKVRTAITVVIFKKILKLSKNSVDLTSVGQILNILSNDLNRFDECFRYCYLVVAPIQAAVVIYILWIYLDIACLGGIAILILFIPFQSVIGRFFAKFRSQTTILTDKRLKLMNEIIGAMRLIKVYCWEQPFAQFVSQTRKEEITKIRYSSFLRGFNIASWFAATRVMLYVCFIGFLYLGGKLSAETVFVTLSLFNTLRNPVTFELPMAIASLAELLVTMRRVEKILLLEERQEEIMIKDSNSSLPEGKVSMKKYTAKWNKALQNESLRNINLDIEPGQLTIIVGQVGSGKTCVLYALLRELERVSGSCQLGGKTSYAPQEAWCLGGTIRENILLGADFDDKKYNEVVRVTGLERDLQLFPNGDRTFVGEKGYTLSGGQKARVTLARAVYHEADVYLLDDPLSAVDPAVANHIFRKCINGFLKDKTVVLVTHQLQFLREADKVVVLNGGSILATGTYAELKSSGIDFLSLLESADKGRSSSVDRKESLKQMSESEVAEEKGRQDDELAALERQGREEEVAKGSVKASVYSNFFTAGTNIFVILFTCSMLLVSQGIYHYIDFYLAGWTDKKSLTESCLNSSTMSTNRVQGNRSLDVSESGFEISGEDKKNIIIYSVLIVLLFVTTFFRTTFIYYVCLRSSTALHDRIFSRVLRSPMAFFENNPLGRILNRFTRDMGLIDQLIPTTLCEVEITLANTLGVAIVSAVVKWYMIIPAVIMVLCSLPFRKVYLQTGRAVKRLDATAQSPVYGLISAAFDGLTTIRAFELQSKFEHLYISRMNDATSCKYISFVVQRGIAFVLDGFALLYICAISSILIVFRDGIPGGLAGVVLSNAIMLIGMFQYGVRQSAEFETQMVSVERVLEYGKLESEPALTSNTENVDLAKWPSDGSIEYKNVTLSYGNSSPVLKNLNFVIKGGEKIGVVGRTGAGKSSLITVLFRLSDFENVVEIDGVDTKSLGLHEVRSKISIIPQDPVLFSGTVRRNLDPFKEYQDDRLWTVLEHANLDKAVLAMEGGLDGEITEGGSNLSVGQRQLLCLARALLKNNKILVLDEATANVDHETDELIQRTIKIKFSNCTVLTVAHRLNTIIDMDKILVLDAGRVVEFDEPYLLLEKRDTFYEMVMQTGPQMAKFLCQTAKTCYYKKHGEDLD